MTTSRRLSIRARITLGSVLVGAIVLTGIALVLHLQVRDATLQTEYSLAESDAAPFITDLRNNPDESPDRPSEGVLVGVRDSDGSWLVDTLPPELQRALPASTDGDRDVLRLEAGRTVYTVVGYRVTTEVGEHLVWAARDGRGSELTVMAVDRSLVVGTVVALFAFAASAWLLTTLALRPVRRMRRTAETLSVDRSAGHLPVGPPGDELSELATTLNAFLDRERGHAARERRMVSDASHELRTPLAALTARLELAHRSFGDAAALEREILGAEGDAARLTHLATTLLELSRLDDDAANGETTVVTTASALVTELMDAVDRARALAGTASLDVDFDVAVDDPQRGYGIDPAAFGRVVDNLVTNAIAFSPVDGVVRVALDQADDAALTLRVTDDGPGVPADFLPVAFDRFTRADVSRRRTGGGSGLGLSLVRGVAARAGGDATLANRATGGAEAAVHLPAR